MLSLQKLFTSAALENLQAFGHMGSRFFKRVSGVVRCFIAKAVAFLSQYF